MASGCRVIVDQGRGVRARGPAPSAPQRLQRTKVGVPSVVRHLRTCRLEPTWLRIMSDDNGDVADEEDDDGGGATVSAVYLTATQGLRLGV